MYIAFMNRLASGFISFKPFRRIIGLSAYKLCPCQTEASQTDRFHLSPRTTEVASNRESSEPFTKVSIAFKRPPFLRSSALSFLRSVSLSDSISNHSSTIAAERVEEQDLSFISQYIIKIFIITKV